MKKYISVVVFALMLLFVFPVELLSQEMKKVSITILNKRTGKPFDKDDVIFEIFGFNTVALAEDALDILENEEYGVISPDVDIMPPDETGFLMATLPSNGAIIVRTGITKSILVPIEYRNEIKLYIEAHEILEGVTMEVKMTSITPEPEEPEVMGNYLIGACKLFIPEKIGRTDSRLIMQPVFVDVKTQDTVHFLKPWVFDGEEYAMTQERRMSYNMDFDPLFKYIGDETLTEEQFSFVWKDTVYMENPMNIYYIRGKIQVEDYNRVYYIEDSIVLASSRVRRPMRFLDYEMDFKQLDPSKYYMKPKPVNMETSGEMSLTFLINKAELDPKNPNNAILLDSLKSELREIHGGENTTLKELTIHGISSPEGPYEKNMSLAKRRTQFAADVVFSSIPEYYRDRIRYVATSAVAPWSDMVTLLENGGWHKEAEEVRTIIAENNTHDQQSRKITKLSYYRSVIVPLLPMLRTVKYTYKYDELREMTAQEVYEMYLNDEDYKSGGKHFELYQYWHLFNLVKDPVELENLYRRAYDETMEDFGKPWVLAANNLAYTLLKKDAPDTTILAPLIDTRFKSNRKVRNAYGAEVISNEAEMVANQLCMFLKTNNYSRASVMAQMLPSGDEEYELFKALTMCLGGYYKGGATEEERLKRAEWADIVMNSSPRNRVVMLLAMNTRGHNILARKAIEELPQDEALTWYFKAIVSGRECKYENSDPMEPIYFTEYLIKCFELDPSFIDLARADGDINERELQLFFKDFPEYNKR